MAWRRGQAYGQDLRDRVLAYPDMTLVEVATRFGVSPSYLSKVRARLRELGDARPGPQRSHLPMRLSPPSGAPTFRASHGRRRLERLASPVGIQHRPPGPTTL